MSLHRVIGPYVFKDTVNSQWYLLLLKNKFVPGFESEQQICKMFGATAHTSNILIDYLNETFGDKVVSRRYLEVKNCGQSWPTHSPDLNPYDYFSGAT